MTTTETSPGLCPCGCGRAVRPGRTYAAVGCFLRWAHQHPDCAANQARLANSRATKARKRIVRWGGKALARLEAVLEAEGVALTRRQRAAVVTVLAEELRTAYQAGRAHTYASDYWHGTRARRQAQRGAA